MVFAISAMRRSAPFALLPLLPLLLVAPACLGSGGGGPLEREVHVAAPGPARAPAFVPFDCEEGTTVPLGERTHCLYTALSTWDEAEQRCLDHGGHLAMPRDSAVREAMLAALGARVSANALWIGLAEPSIGHWVWSNGAPPGFEGWAPGEPNNAGNEHCAEWLVASGTWNDLNCAARHPFLCEGWTDGAPLACAGARFTLGAHEYCVNDAPESWQDALSSCVASGGNLAMLETEEENAALVRALAPRLPGSLWLGLGDREREGDFRWIGGEPLRDAAWRGGEPNNAGEEDCAEWSPSDGLWNDLPCGARLASLCERPSEGGVHRADTSSSIAAPAEGEIAPISWLGMGPDRIGQGGNGTPDGKADGRFGLVVPRSGTIQLIEVQSADASGRPSGGQRWHSRDPSAWMVGVLAQGRLLHPTYAQAIGAFPVGTALEILVDDSGWFHSGNWVLVDVLWADGQGIRRLLQIP